MSAILLAPPAVEPISLAEAKAYLRVEHDADDAVIGSLITAARSHVEAMTRRALISQTWRLVRDAWPAGGRLRLAMGPLQAIVAIRSYDDAGAAHLHDAAAFVADRAALAIAAPPFAIPLAGRRSAGIELDLRLGYGDGAADVPETLRLSLRMLVAHSYENRGLIAIGQSVAMMPASVNALIASHRVASL